MSEEEQLTDFEQNESSQISNNVVTKGKQVNDFKQFIVKYSFISSILMWTLSDRAQNLIRLGIDAFVDPIFAIDLNNDGEPDIDRIKRLQLSFCGIHIKYGEFLVELVKSIIVCYGMYNIINYLIKNTDIFE
tara:strand:- start:197 stop:592 length:396 start_codon:yes stop_codon:yes gene_type:complete